MAGCRVWGTGPRRLARWLHVEGRPHLSVEERDAVEKGPGMRSWRRDPAVTGYDSGWGGVGLKTLLVPVWEDPPTPRDAAGT